MGLTLFLKEPPCKTCDRNEVIDFGYTYNVSPMWYEIFPSDEKMVPIEGMSGLEAFDRLNFALGELINNKKKFEKMNPPNGWGDYEEFKDFISKLIKASEDHPEWIWEACR